MKYGALTGTVLIVFASVGAASAADVAMPVKAPVSAVTVDHWSGAYIGIHAGYGWGTKDWYESPGFGGHFHGHGFVGGGQIGFNLHIGGSWVLGLEADGSWSNAKLDNTTLLGLVSSTNTVSSFESKIDWIASVAFRVGIAADRLLVYGKLGAAVVHEQHSLSEVTAVGAATTFATRVSASETRVGPLFGLGAEYALGDRWSAKIEYNYIPFTDQSINLAGTSGAPGAETPFDVQRQIGQALHLAKVGVNYRFGSAPPSAPAPVRAAGYDWSGLYLGGQGGYGWGRKTWLSFDPAQTYDVSGWVGGGQVGFNAQAGRVVLGVEAEGLWSNIDGDVSFNSGTTSIELATRVRWLAMVTGRVGYAYWDRWLPYLKAGVAFAEDRHDQTNIATTFTTSTVSSPGKQMRNGWVIGGGTEYAFAGNWSIRVEYNYVDFGTRTDEMIAVQTAGGVSQNVGLTNEIKQHLHLVKLGLNYRFGLAPAAVVARY
jgi:outer membrane immunogenic protein